MSQNYGPRDDEESIRTIHRALDLGITFFDTAAIYGEGHNETVVGRGLGARRKDIVLATKCGIVPAVPGPGIDANGTPAEITSSCDASLRRLGTDVIDLFYLHRVDPKVPIEESVGALASLVRAGKVRHIGLSEAAPATIRRAHKVHPITALQSEYSLWYREPEQGVLPVCRELGIAFVPFSPLGRGFLSGAVKDPGRWPLTTCAGACPGFRGTTSITISRWSSGSRKWQTAGRVLLDPAARARPRSSRSRGCWRKGTTSCRFPAPSA